MKLHEIVQKVCGVSRDELAWNKHTPRVQMAKAIIAYTIHQRNISTEMIARMMGQSTSNTHRCIKIVEGFVQVKDKETLNIIRQIESYEKEN